MAVALIIGKVSLTVRARETGSVRMIRAKIATLPNLKLLAIADRAIPRAMDKNIAETATGTVNALSGTYSPMVYRAVVNKI